MDPETGQGKPFSTYVYATQIAEVDVDDETGEVEGLDMPEIEVDIVDSYDPTGPFGAKGVGEPTSVPTAAAILNAIHNAVGVRITSLPATPEKILTAIKTKRAQGQSEYHQKMDVLLCS